MRNDVDYWVAVKHRARLLKPYTWEIRSSGRALPVVRSHVPLLQLTWTLLHPIDEQSPLHGLKQDALDAAEAEVIVSLVGLDETLSQTIQARHSYISSEIEHDAFFEDVLTRNGSGVEVNYNLFHTVRHGVPENRGKKTAII